MDLPPLRLEVRICPVEYPALYALIANQTNSRLRSRLLKRLASAGLLGAGGTPPQVAVAPPQAPAAALPAPVPKAARVFPVEHFARAAASK